MNHVAPGHVLMHRDTLGNTAQSADEERAWLTPSHHYGDETDITEGIARELRENGVCPTGAGHDTITPGNVRDWFDVVNIDAVLVE